jgi:hypothetical protein
MRESTVTKREITGRATVNKRNQTDDPTFNQEALPEGAARFAAPTFFVTASHTAGPSVNKRC